MRSPVARLARRCVAARHARALVAFAGAALLALACSSSHHGGDADSRDANAEADASAKTEHGAAEDAAVAAEDRTLIVPEGLIVNALAGGNGVLDVTALTLREQDGHAELYAALKNTGTTAACHAALSVELYDKDEEAIAAGISGLLSQHFYRLTDGSGAIATCVAPGDVAMAAITDFAANIALEDVGTVVYRCPYFALDVEPIDGLTVSRVERVTRDTGTAYTGILVNGFDETVSDPSVVVFPVNAEGRPLGFATSDDARAIAAGESWHFETNAVNESGTDQRAFPVGALSN